MYSLGDTPTSFLNIIYLYSNDIYTLEEISKLCGNKYVNNKFLPLVTVDDLKLLENFEAVILLPRIMPFRTKLVPDYRINWGFDEENISLEERK